VADLRLTRHEANADVGDLAAPTPARSAPAPTVPPVTITVNELAPGVWMLAGQSHHSVVVEFRDHLALIEAPQNDVRTLAVIQRARELRPGKPLTRVINTHHHFDHSGGVRAAVAEGLALQTHQGNVAFFRNVLSRPHTIAPDALARRPNRAPRIVGLTDGELHNDGVGSMRFLHPAGSPHSDTMLAVYLPQHRILIQADLYNPPPANAPANLTFPFAASLVEAVRRSNLQVDRVAGIHGAVVPWDEVVQAAARR
jgi:glyoxylase-like metal-dependent hydrolase (beta-lactamase superfamily II)